MPQIEEHRMWGYSGPSDAWVSVLLQASWVSVRSMPRCEHGEDASVLRGSARSDAPEIGTEALEGCANGKR